MNQSIANAIYAGSQYSLVAAAMSLTYSVGRFINFSLGALYALTAYSTCWFVDAGLPFWPGACAGMVLSGLAGAACDYVVFRRLRQRGATPLVALIAALGVLVVVQGTLAILFGEGVKVMRYESVVAGVDILGARLTPIQLLGIIGACLASGATWVLLQYTIIGRQLRAVASDPTLAEVVGVSADRVYLLTGVMCSVLVGIAGIVGGYDTGLRPTMGFPPLLMGIIAMLAGGAGSPLRACFAALLIAGVQEAAVIVLPTQWQLTIVFMVLVIVLLLRAGHFSDVELSATSEAMLN